MTIENVKFWCLHVGTLFLSRLTNICHYTSFDFHSIIYSTFHNQIDTTVPSRNDFQTPKSMKLLTASDI